jgi:hypothetical protein
MRIPCLHYSCIIRVCTFATIARQLHALSSGVERGGIARSTPPSVAARCRSAEAGDPRELGEYKSRRAESYEHHGSIAPRYAPRHHAPSVGAAGRCVAQPPDLRTVGVSRRGKRAWEAYGSGARRGDETEGGRP